MWSNLCVINLPTRYVNKFSSKKIESILCKEVKKKWSLWAKPIIGAKLVEDRRQKNILRKKFYFSWFVTPGLTQIFKTLSGFSKRSREQNEFMIWLEYRKVASSRQVYYSILDLFFQRSQYISIKFPLYKRSENLWACY